MSTTTPNLGLTKPAGSDFIDINVLNANFDILDGTGILVFQTLTDLQTAFPNGYNRPVWVVADTNWYYWSGAVAVNVSSVVATSSITAIAPVISIAGSITVSSVIATTNAQALSPSLSIAGSVSISAITATSTTQSLNPTLSTDMTISAVLAQTTTTAKAPTVSSGPVTLISDSFNRADNSSTMGSTDSAYGGTSQAWSTGAYVYGISSNQGYLTAGTNAPAWVDAGKSDVNIQCTFPILATSSAVHNVVARLTDNNNFYMFQSNGTQLNFMKKVSGSYTTIQTITFAATAGDIMKVSLSGSSITLYMNGVQKGQWTDTTYATQTKHGIMGGSSSSRFDDFSISG